MPTILPVTAGSSHVIRKIVIAAVVVVAALLSYLLWSGKLGIDIGRFFASEPAGYVPIELRQGFAEAQCGVPSGEGSLGNLIIYTEGHQSGGLAIQRGHVGTKSLPDCADYWCWLPSVDYNHAVPPETPGAAAYFDDNVDDDACYEYRVKYGSSETSNSVYCPLSCAPDTSPEWTAGPRLAIQRNSVVSFVGNVSGGNPGAPVEIFIARPDGSILREFRDGDVTRAAGGWDTVNTQGLLSVATGPVKLTSEGQVGTYTSWATVGGVKTNVVTHEVIHAQPTPTPSFYPTPPVPSCVPLPECVYSNPACAFDPLPGVEYCPPVTPTPTTSIPPIPVPALRVFPRILSGGVIPGQTVEVILETDLGPEPITAMQIHIVGQGGHFEQFIPSADFSDVLERRKITPFEDIITLGTGTSGRIGKAIVGTYTVGTSEVEATSNEFSVSILGDSFATKAGSDNPVPIESVTSSVPWRAASVPGDANGDGIVNIFDYNIVVSNFGRTGRGIPGDLNNDGVVDLFDYNLVVSNFLQ